MVIESPFLGYPTCLILLKWFGGQRHCGRQAQQGGEDQGGRLHLHASLQLELFQL